MVLPLPKWLVLCYTWINYTITRTGNLKMRREADWVSGKKKYEAPNAELIDLTTIMGGVAGSCRAWATEENGWTRLDGKDGWVVRRDSAREIDDLWDGAFCYHLPSADLMLYTS